MGLNIFTCGFTAGFDPQNRYWQRLGILPELFAASNPIS